GEQEGGGFPRRIDLGLGRAGFERRIDVDGEAAAGTSVDPRPRVDDVRRWSNGHCRCMQEPVPFHEALLDLARAVSEIFTRPDGVFFQIPAQLFRLDWTNGSDESP